jgi:hypothetical protein
MSDADGWAFADRFQDAVSYSAQKKVLKEVLAEFKAANGGFWPRWVEYANAFRDWQFSKAERLNQAMYAWQSQQDPPTQIMPSDDKMADWSKQIVLLGKNAYGTALSDPGKLPRYEVDSRDENNFRVPGRGYYNKGLISAQVDKALSLGGRGTSGNPIGFPSVGDKLPRGWSSDPLKFMTFAELDANQRGEYLSRLPALFEGVVPRLKFTRRDRGFPAAIPSAYWDFYWVYDAQGQGWKSNPSGAEIPFQLVGYWKWPGKSMEKADLQAALADTQKAFRGALSLKDKGTNQRLSLGEVVSELLRKKSPKAGKEVRTPSLKFVSTPMTGNRNRDTKVWQKVLTGTRF